MHFDVMGLFMLLVADLWNTHVVPTRTGNVPPADSSAASPGSGLLRRRRREDPQMEVDSKLHVCFYLHILRVAAGQPLQVEDI